jgi:site-specific recombinase XerD
MLEYWYRERRTLVDFRRGPLGPHFDGLSAYLKEKQYSVGGARSILSRGCLFNDFLLEKDITDCREISQALIDEFLDEYLRDHRTTSLYKTARASCRGVLRRVVDYLKAAGVAIPNEKESVPTAFRWILDPYLHYLRQTCQLAEKTIRRKLVIACGFLEGLGSSATRRGMKTLRPETVEQYLVKHMKDSPENRRTLTSALRGFLRFCAERRYMNCDLSTVIPSVPSYRHASLPKGMEDSALQRMLNAVPVDTKTGARDYAIMLLMMAYGIRGKSAAEVLLDDINWRRSTIRIRAQKGGKEVILPLLESVGEALVRYLRCRHETPLRELFVTTRAPVNPLNGQMISRLIRRYMNEAGVHIPRGGSGMLRHSWAIRALAHDSPIKAIADVLGHRCLDTTFIYAKADLKMLRQVTMPWPEGR